MATCHDAVPNEPDEKVLVDVDLSILGEAPDRFDEYEDQVREEYSWVPAVVFWTKRREILRGFLARASIFNTREFVEAYEARARANLERSIKRLGA
jgi:predicted metal-dependent HD superfamily phosphohydrolase